MPRASFRISFSPISTLPCRASPLIRTPMRNSRKNGLVGSTLHPLIPTTLPNLRIEGLHILLHDHLLPILTLSGFRTLLLDSEDKPGQLYLPGLNMIFFKGRHIPQKGSKLGGYAFVYHGYVTSTNDINITRDLADVDELT